MIKKTFGFTTLILCTLLGCPPTATNPNPPAITCGPTDAGTCAGTCPANQQCSMPSPTVCACVDIDAGPTFCAFNAAHVCGGPCPKGQSCVTHGPTVCACFPSPDGG